MSSTIDPFAQVQQLVARLEKTAVSALPSNANDQDKAKAKMEAMRNALQLIEKSNSHLKFDEIKDNEVRVSLEQMVKDQEKLFLSLETNIEPLEEKKKSGTALTASEVAFYKFLLQHKQLLDKSVGSVCFFVDAHHKTNNDDKYSSFKRKRTSGKVFSCYCVDGCLKSCPCVLNNAVCVKSTCECKKCANTSALVV